MTTSPGSISVLHTRSITCWPPAVTSRSSISTCMPSAAITCAMHSLTSSSPSVGPYCSSRAPERLGVSSRPIHSLSSHAAVEFVLDLLQGAGIAAAIGISPFMPVLLAGALAMGDVGLDFDGTDFAFMEQWWFLAVVFVVVLVADFLRRRETPPIVWLLLAVAVVLGALQGAASLADRDHPIVPGIIAGVLTAALGFYA